MTVTRPRSAITVSLVRSLVAAQFPEWAHLPIRPVAHGGSDNRTFHLGEEMLVRLPSGPEYASAVEREQRWLPFLAPQLPVPIPKPVAMGEPADDYPWHWSIYRWIYGKALHYSEGVDLIVLGKEVGEFLSALQAIDATGGPRSGPESFYRGGPLSVYAGQVVRAIEIHRKQLDTISILEVWNRSLESSWERSPVWVHGDMSAGNLLVHNGKLSGVIDFGQLSVGDPACDLAIAWTVLDEEGRSAFRKALPLDSETWTRGRGWALWKGLIVAAELVESTAVEADRCWRSIGEVISDHVVSEA